MQGEKAKSRFEGLTALYYYQLTRGCGDPECDQKLCASCRRFRVKLSPEAAAVLAIQYASTQSCSSLKLCTRVAKISVSQCQSALSELINPTSDPPSHVSSGDVTEPQAKNIWKSPLYKFFLTSLPFGKEGKSLPSGSSARSTQDALPQGMSTVHLSNGQTKLRRISRTESLDFQLLGVTADVVAGIHGEPEADQAVLHSLNGLTLKSSSRVKSDYDLPSLSSYSQKLTAFRDPSLRASNDSLSSLDAASLEHVTTTASITLEYFTRLVASSSSLGPQDIASKLKETLGSLEAIAASKSLSGEQLFSIFELFSSSVLQAALAEATESLLVQLETAMARVGWTNVLPFNWMSGFSVLLLNPLLAQKAHFDGLTRRTCKLVGSLRHKAKSWLIDSLGDLSPTRFGSIVAMLQDYLSATYQETVHSAHDTSVYCIKVLSLFYVANGAQADQPLQPSAFYNSSVCQKTNFKEEYKRWQRFLSEKKSVREFSVFFFPFLLSPDEKARVLHIDAMAQMSSHYEDAFVKQALVTQAQRFLPESAIVDKMEKNMLQVGMTNPYLLLEVRRSHLVQDTLQQITRKINDVKKPLKVKFVNGGEEGMDQGGVQKEFFQVLVDALLDPEYGMFVSESDTRYLWFNAFSMEPLISYELVGIILGLALYNGIHLCLPFAPLVYRKLLGSPVGLCDMHTAFPALARGLEQLLSWTDGDVADVFMRTFTIEYATFGTTREFELCDQGDLIPVNNENRELFVKLYVDHYLTKSVDNCFEAFRKGFWKAVGADAVKLCSASELEQLLCGSSLLDFHELELAAQYEELTPDSELVKNFWHVVHNVMDSEQRRLLLVFVTASDRVPLRGLGKVQFVLQRNGPDTDRLPSALTCFGRLLLPEYSSREKLQEKLLTAIQNAKGFGLV